MSRPPIPPRWGTAGPVPAPLERAWGTRQHWDRDSLPPKIRISSGSPGTRAGVFQKQRPAQPHPPPASSASLQSFF